MLAFLRMFKSSMDEWVAGLDVEYTTVLQREKILKEAEKKKPAVIQVCVHNILDTVFHGLGSASRKPTPSAEAPPSWTMN